jgi:hypothetical protein
MSYYRVYFLGSRNQFIGVKELECDDDRAARELAQELAQDTPVEVWQQSRFAFRLNPAARGRRPATLAGQV